MTEQPGESGQQAGGKGWIRRRPPKVITITAVLAVIALGVVGSVLWVTGAGHRTDAPAAAQVRLEAISTPGDNPFMNPVGQDRVTTPTPGAAGAFSGDTPGLFAATGDERSCDRQALVANLQADPAKAGAWAAALEITAADIPGFVQSLTPVVLRSDTAVTSHGYQNGTFAPYPAVLQAGTAVFVNGFGEPTVKCFSGNPLTRPVDYAQAEYVGQPWGYWQPRSVVYVQPSRVVIDNYVYVDHGRRYEHRNWCWEHRDSSFCGHPNPDTSCDKHPNFEGCQGRNEGGNPREDFCRANPGKCDSDGIPVLCKGINGPGADPRCSTGGSSGGTKTDPTLDENLKKATQAATEARAAADARKADADAAALALRNAQADDATKVAALDKAKQELAAAQLEAKQASDALFLNPNDPNLQLRFKQADNLRSEKIEAVQARTLEEAASAAAVKKVSDEAEQRANQAKFAEAAATNAENVEKIAEKNAKDAQTNNGGQGQKGQQNQNGQQLQQQQLKQQQQKQDQQLQQGQNGQNGQQLRQQQLKRQQQQQQIQQQQVQQQQLLQQQQLQKQQQLKQQQQGQNGQQQDQQKQGQEDQNGQ